MAEIDVEVVRKSDDAMLVTDGDNEGWVPYSLIDSDSDIDRKSEKGTTGELIIPQWKAEKLGLV
jgi:hypothetical protein